MRYAIGIVVLGFVMTGCGGGGSDAPTAAPPAGLIIRLVQAGVGNPIAFGPVRLEARSYHMTVELSDTGSCCTIGGDAPIVTLASGTTNAQGQLSAPALTAEQLPAVADMLTVTYVGVDPKDAAVNIAVNAFFNSGAFPTTGYFLSGDGPGYALRTIRVERDGLIGTQTITLSLNPL